MKQYKELEKVFHMDASSSRDANLQKELDARLNSESAFRIGYSTPNGELFFTVPKELSVLNEEVLRAESRIADLLGQLPEIARSAVLRSIVLDEVVCTNAIEDVHSTRRQIKDAMNAVVSGSPKKRRFKELATLYLAIIDGTDKPPRTVEDIRSIYDMVTAGEIPQDKLPDGMFFRKEGVDITAGGVKVIHSGLEPESKIIEALNVMLSLAEDAGIPSLYGSIISHYLFEYTHPFYDGNGRTGRYLLSVYLSRCLSAPTALSLSRTIAENKDAYYRAFKTVEKPLNHAELTFFLSILLDLVQTAQYGMIERLNDSISALDNIDDAMDTAEECKKLKGKENDIVFLLLQYEAFGLFGDATLPEIAEYLHVGKQQARKYLASMEEKGICEKVSSYNPVTFALTQEFKNEIGITSTQEADDTL